MQIGVWLTQINSIIKIFCAICGARSDVKEILAEIAEEIINLLNQINLSETHIPFCAVCAVCERIDGFSQKPQKSQKKIINLINQINLSEPHVVCDEGVLQYAPTGEVG